MSNDRRAITAANRPDEISKMGENHTTRGRSVFVQPVSSLIIATYGSGGCPSGK